MTTMKIVVEQLEDILSRLKTVEVRLSTLTSNEDEDKIYLDKAESLLMKYTAEVLALENIILQKKLLLQRPQS